MKPLETAIVGCGGIAQVHAAVLKKIQDCRITACVDIKPERAEKMAEACGARAYSSLEEMLADQRPDVMHVCTPHCCHVPQAEAAAREGIAVFCEKPPAMNREQWERMKRTAEKVPVGICFQNRFNPNVEAAEEMLRKGELGKVLGGRAFLTWRRDAGYYQDDWHGQWEKEGGGALINQAIHTLDLLIRFLGKADQVKAVMDNQHLMDVMQEEDTVAMYLLCGERRGTLYAATSSVRDEPVILEIQAEKGKLRLEDNRLEIHTREGIQIRSFQEDQRQGKSYWGAGHERCIADFYDALRTGRTWRNTVSSCENTMEALLAAYDQTRSTLIKNCQSTNCILLG